MRRRTYILLMVLVAPLVTMAQNVGIGTNTPAYKLDVAGRLRLRHTSGQTAGVWFDGSVNSNVAFIGMYDNATLGLYGSVSGWQFVMDTDNGNIGIGTAAPSAKLDLNGDLRLRGNFPANGATLVSKDGSGNTAWQKAYAFRAEGLLGNSDITLPSNTYTKIMFNSIAAYNVGVVYQPINSLFDTPVKGIYHFNAQLETFANTNSTSGSVTMQLMRTRNGVSTVLAENYFGTYVAGDISSLRPQMTKQLSGDFLLEAGDEIWVRTYSFLDHTCYGAPAKTSFSGHLITQLF